MATKMKSKASRTTRRKAAPKRAIGRKSTAGAKTGTRKKVPAKRAVLRIPPTPTGRYTPQALDRWRDAVEAIPVRFTGQPAYVRDVWESMIDGFGKVSSSGEVVTMSDDYDEWLWRKHPRELKGRKTVSVRLLEDGKVIAMRGPTRNPARRAKSKKTRNPASKAPKRKRAGRPLREGQRIFHCAKKRR